MSTRYVYQYAHIYGYVKYLWRNCGLWCLYLKFYDYEELRGFDIYDSAGLFYGFVCGVIFREDNVYVKACIRVVAEDSVPDIDSLKKMLRSKNISVKDESLDVLVTLAREHGLDIPYKVIGQNIELVKGIFPVSEIELIDEYYEGATRKGVILLNTPREALYRGRKVEISSPVPLPEKIVGKLVISRKNGVLGKAHSIVIGPGQPGLRVKRLKELKGYISWLKYTSDMKKKYPQVYEKLAAIKDPLINRRVGLEEYDLLISEMKKRGIPEEIIREIDKYIVSTEEGLSLFVDIPWSKILVVNEVVIVE